MAPPPGSPDATLPVGSPLLAAELIEAEPLPALVDMPPAAPEGPVEDYDLMYLGSEAEPEEIDVPLDAVEAPKQAEPMSATQFADELIGLVDSVFQEFAAPAGSALRSRRPSSLRGARSS